MSKQFHYVVVFNEEYKRWDIEPEIYLNFDNGSIWDDETNGWLTPYSELEDNDDEESAEMSKRYFDKETKLALALNKLTAEEK